MKYECTQPTVVLPDVATVQHAVHTHFPGLWTAVDLGLSVCASILLADIANAVTLIYVGGPSSTMTTVIDIMKKHPLVYHTDNFTVAALVTNAANLSEEQLKKVDMLPRIRYKILATPEMASVFRGKEDELTKKFAILTRVLDGEGLATDTGTHGCRDLRGDYILAWLGATTPLEAKLWRVMLQLGSRLFFLLMDSSEEVTVADLVKGNKQVSYKERLAHCQDAASAVLTRLFPAAQKKCS